MDFTIIDMPQQQSNVVFSNVFNCFTSPLNGQQQQANSQLHSGVNAFAVNWTYSGNGKVINTQPIPYLVCCIESVSVLVDVSNIHVCFSCSRGLLFTIDGNVHGPQDPKQFFNWKQQSGVSF